MSFNRRQFLKAATALSASSFATACSHQARWAPGAYRRPNQSRVAILKVKSYAEDLISPILDGIRAFPLDVQNKKILLKPNLVEYERDNVINTHPAVIGAAIEAFRRLGAKEVVVGEGPGHRRDTD